MLFIPYMMLYVKNTWWGTLALLLSSCVILGKLLTRSEFVSSFLRRDMETFLRRDISLTELS